MTLEMMFQEKYEEGFEIGYKIGVEIAKLEIAGWLLQMGKFSLEDIAVWSGLPLEKVQEIADMQS